MADQQAEADSIVPELLGPTPEKVAPPPEADRSSPTDGARPPWQVPMALFVLCSLLLAVAWLFFFGDDADDEAGAPPSTGSATTSTVDPGSSAADEDLPIDVLIDGGVATYRGPTELPIGEEVEVTVDVVDADGQPVVGVPWFLTVGSETTAADAVHDETVTDEQGRATFTVVVPGPSTRRGIWTSDGESVWQVTSDAAAVDP